MSKAPQFANYERIDSKKLEKKDQEDTEVAVIKFADMSGGQTGCNSTPLIAAATPSNRKEFWMISQKL